MSNTLRIAVALNLAEPYVQHQNVFLGIRQYAREHLHWKLVVDECPGFQQTQRAPLFQHYDGVIARASPALQRRLKRLPVPLVNTWYQHAKPGLPGVYLDPQRMGELAAEHLLERGFRRLSFLCDGTSQAALAALAAFTRRGTDAGAEVVVQHLPPLPGQVEHDSLKIEKCFTAWLDTLTPPVGVCIPEAAWSRLLIGLCEVHGWQVPHDLAIVSLNDNRMIAELSPQITAIDHNFERVGYEAAALLERLIAGEPPPREPIFIPPKGVVARQSTDYFAVEDVLVANALRYISTRLEEKLGIQRIAQALAVSPRTLQLRFSAALGRPLSEEICRLRLTMAQRMLADPSRPIGDIARKAGFGTGIIMNHVFHRELGMSPKEYRNQVLG